MDKEKLQVVNHAVVKKDAYPIMTGGAVYTEDLVPDNALVIKVLRSPYACARVKAVHAEQALAIPGVELVLSWKDVPQIRHNYSGESFPGNNPLDRMILEELVRYIGDPVAIIAAESEKLARKAMSLITVDYEVLTPVIDYEKAEGAAEIVHPEDDYVYPLEIGGDYKRNVLGTEFAEGGNFEEEYAKCPVQLDETYYTDATQQAMLETFRSFSYYDYDGRLTVVSSTQVPFHVRRLVSFALGMPRGSVRVIKPRVGGGFGAKQSLNTEIYSALVTKMTGRPAYYCLSRTETFCCTNTRHRFRIRVRVGATEDGVVKAIWVDSLQDCGAYGDHAVNTISLSGHKTMPLYSKANAWRFTGKSVYTNNTPGGAFRGFGATQGTFAVESTINKMCMQLGLDPTEVRLKNIPHAGEVMPAYFGETLQSISLDRCIATGKKMIGWDEKYCSRPLSRQVGPHTYRGLGMAITMQGSGLSHLDTCAARIQLNDTDCYTLHIGSADIGTGCDTILAQMAAEVLECKIEQITVTGVDTEHSPFDKGSYASSTTYVTGNAVVLAAKKLREQLVEAAAGRMEVPVETVDFDGSLFTSGEKSYSLSDLAMFSVFGHGEWMSAGATFCGQQSPPPFVAGFAEVEVDTETGSVKLLDFTGVVDCGTVINKALAKVQAEGGFSQGIGMALYEREYTAPNGKLMTNNYMNYKIPSRLDVPVIHAAFEESCEPSGPFGAKSIGEVVINTPSPAICSAIRNAVGAEIHRLPARAEDVWMALNGK